MPETCTTCGKTTKGPRQLAIHQLLKHPSNGLKRADAFTTASGPGPNAEGKANNEGGKTMPKVKAATCPTCGHNHDGERTFEVPETHVVDAKAVEELKDAVESGFERVESFFDRHPKPTKGLFQTWLDCPECKLEYEAAQKAIADAALHDCPGCKEKAAKIAELSKPPVPTPSPAAPVAPNVTAGAPASVPAGTTAGERRWWDKP